MLNKLVSNVHIYSAIKNVIHYLVPLSIMVASGFSFDWITAMLGLIGVVVAYHSVYYLNDLIDYEEDKKDDVKKMTKPLARGDVNPLDYISRMYLSVIFGLLITSYVSVYLTIATFLMLFLNYLHSDRNVRIKKTPLVGINLYLIEFIKFSSAWYILGFDDFVNLPFAIPSFFAASYVLGYYAYKNPDNDAIKVLKSKGLESILIAIILVLSFILAIKTMFIIPLTITMLFSLLLIIPNSQKGKHKFITGATIILSLYIVFIISNLLLFYFKK